MVIKKLIEEYESKVEEKEGKIEDKERVERVEDKEKIEDKGISKIRIVPAEEVIEEEIKGRGRPRLTEEEKEERRIEEEEERMSRPIPRTPYVGGTPALEDSGGWCLTESKTVTTIADKRTGTKKIMINGTEVSRR